MRRQRIVKWYSFIIVVLHNLNIVVMDKILTYSGLAKILKVCAMLFQQEECPGLVGAF